MIYCSGKESSLFEINCINFIRFHSEHALYNYFVYKSKCKDLERFHPYF